MGTDTFDPDYRRPDLVLLLLKLNNKFCVKLGSSYSVHRQVLRRRTAQVWPVLYATINRLRHLALQEESNPSTESCFELLRTIDRIRLAAETPTETILRLIYRV